jgi:predicted lipoprotein with Yx(FWY)xxD motif
VATAFWSPARVKSSALLVVPVALLAVACGSSSSSTGTTHAAAASPTATSATSTAASGGVTRIATARVRGVGNVLVSGKGLALYVYMPEKGGQIKCQGGCTSLWPPLAVPSGRKPETSSAVHPHLVGTVANPAGGSIITYAHWPLHTHASDKTPASYLGQGSGGQWFLISPSGTPTTKPVSSGSAGSTGSSGY